MTVGYPESLSLQAIQWNDNDLADEIHNKLEASKQSIPLQNQEKNGLKEYTASLDNIKNFSNSLKHIPSTSNLRKGHIYYYAATNDLVVVFQHNNIAPYEDYEIGKINGDISYQSLKYIDVSTKHSQK